jgi:hypothetical protein
MYTWENKNAVLQCIAIDVTLMHFVNAKGAPSNGGNDCVLRRF